MSANGIEAGKAYVRVLWRDGEAQTGIARIETRMGAFLRGVAASTATAQQIAAAATSAQAEKVASSLASQKQVVNDQVDGMMQVLRTMRQQGASEADQKSMRQQVRDLIAQRRQLEDQINTALSRRQSLSQSEQQAAATVNAEKEKASSEADRQNRSDGIRNSRMAQYLAQLKAAEKSAALATQSGRGSAARVLQTQSDRRSAGGAQTLSQADSILGRLQQQRNVLNDQVSALMQLLRTMRQQGAELAAQAAVAEQVRDLVSQRKPLEEQINVATNRRVELEQREADLAEKASALAIEKAAQDEQAWRNADREARARDLAAAARERELEAAERIRANDAARASTRAPFEANAAFGRSAGLSPETMAKFAGSVKHVNRTALATGGILTSMARGAGTASRAFGGFNGIASQTAFLADDLMAGYGMGGVSGALRASTNNIMMLLLPFGGWVTLAGTAIAIGVQLGLVWKKHADQAKEAVDWVGAYTDKLRDNLDAQRGLAEIRRTFGDSELTEVIRSREDKKADLQIDARDALNRFSGLQVKRSKGENVNEKEYQEANERVVVALRRVHQIEQQIIAAKEKRAKLQIAEMERAQFEAQYAREYRKHQKDLDAAGPSPQQEAQWSAALRQHQRQVYGGMKSEVLKDNDPKAAKRAEILNTARQRISDIALLPLDQQRELRKEIASAANKQLRELDPVRTIGKELTGELDPEKAQKQEIREKTNARLKEVDAELKAMRETTAERQKLRASINAERWFIGNTEHEAGKPKRIEDAQRKLTMLQPDDPKRQQELLQLRQQILMAENKKLSDLNPKLPSLANAGTDARSIEAFRAIVDATTDRRTREQKMLELQRRQVELTQAQLKQNKETHKLIEKQSPPQKKKA